MAKQKLNGVGLALAGGGWRAFSQIPVLEQMEQEGIRIAAVAGTSMGALIATLVASGLESPEITRLVTKLDQSIVESGAMKAGAGNVLNLVKSTGAIDGQVMIDHISPILEEAGVKTMSDIEMPLALVSVDVYTGELVVFTNKEGVFEGEPGAWTTLVGDYDLAHCIAASAAYPLLVIPVPYMNHTFVDGGVRMNFPTALFDHEQVDAVVGIDMMRTYDPVDSLNPLTESKRCLDYCMQQIEMLYATACDVRVNINIPSQETFAPGSANEVIQQSRDWLKTHPVDWKEAKPGLFSSIRRAAAAHASTIIRAAVPVGESRKVPANHETR